MSLFGVKWSGTNTAERGIQNPLRALDLLEFVDCQRRGKLIGKVDINLDHENLARSTMSLPACAAKIFSVIVMPIRCRPSSRFYLWGVGNQSLGQDRACRGYGPLAALRLGSLLALPSSRLAITVEAKSATVSDSETGSSR